MFNSGRAQFFTGGDDLREGSKLYLRFILRDGSIGATTGFSVAGGTEFDSNTNLEKSWVFEERSRSLDIADVFRIEVAFSPDRREFMEDDDYSFDGLILTVDDGGTDVVLFSDTAINRKFEQASVWRSPQLPTFEAIGIRTIIVRDQDDQRVGGALIYLEHVFLGVTDENGEFVTTETIDDRSHLVVRKLIHENGFYRSNHDVDSEQNWNYRVHLTNVGISNAGRATPHFRWDGTAHVTLRKDNTLIGVNLLYTLEWDADSDERDTIADTIRQSSDALHGATNGQFFIEFARITSRRQWWDDCDYRVYVEDHRRGIARIRGGFLGNNISHSFINIGRKSGVGTLVHEFGHYGFGLADEYKGSDPNCTAALNAEPGDPDGGFRRGTSRAACIMTVNSVPKFCSHHPSNPHKLGTNQGDNSCWDTIVGNYGDDERWYLRDPASRSALPGPLRWSATSAPDITTHPMVKTEFIQTPNDPLPGRIGTVDLTIVDELGRAVSGAAVSTRDRNGTWFFQGISDRYGEASVGGAHLGDHIRFELGDVSAQSTISSDAANQTFSVPA